MSVWKKVHTFSIQKDNIFQCFDVVQSILQPSTYIVAATSFFLHMFCLKNETFTEYKLPVNQLDEVNIVRVVKFSPLKNNFLPLELMVLQYDFYLQTLTSMSTFQRYFLKDMVVQ